jgi:hypothetical protein
MVGADSPAFSRLKRARWQFSALGTLREYSPGMTRQRSPTGNDEMPDSEMKHSTAPRIEDASAREGHDIELPRKVLGVMAMTTALTFATLTTGYQLFFSHSVFA